MTTSKRSSTPAKNGKNNLTNRQKGLDYFRSMLTLAKTNGDDSNIRKYKAIINCLESLDEREKKRND